MSIVAPSGTALRVLVVDPSECETAGTLAPLLQLPGSEFRLASDQSSALEIVATLRPNVALIDLGMPRMEGFHLARQLRQSGLPQVWLVAGSPFGDKAFRTLAKDAGFDDFVMKPYTSCRLQGLIEKFLNSSAGPQPNPAQPDLRIDPTHSIQAH